jgi:hypothetical protein
MNLADLHTELRGMQGLAGLPAPQRAFLLNEGYTELVTRSEWGKALVSVPTVANQAAYALAAESANLGERILRLWADGKQLDQSSESEARSVALGNQILNSDGLYWISFDAAGVEKVSIYPAPTEDGLLIEVELVPEPAPLANPTDTPKLPKRFHRAIVDYAASEAYAANGDQDRQVYFQQRFEGKVADLSILRNSRQGRGVVQMQVENWHY